MCRAVDGGHLLCDAAELDGHDCDGLILVGHGHREDCESVGRTVSLMGRTVCLWGEEDCESVGRTVSLWRGL